MFRPIVLISKDRLRIILKECSKSELSHFETTWCNDSAKCDLYCRRIVFYGYENDLFKLVKSIIENKNIALLNLRHENPEIRKLCELVMSNTDIDIRMLKT